ncbi:DUF881 domain-containing protein [Geodermatophilus ruber]|uniref:Uncharacterized conserved protein YlxW, UPF0749 family n=1 Tax=Geodermatophilus ruber TaxID=504800 RepID=A0A1I4BRT0_9ACTN|nr:DUF881 domain-containing protein [Geodermatophilus ruber]SFK71233.1 Uncharacterized conserved protein YlxW, UPF0749 family [Geodermatophilus ruber]
MSDDQRPAAGPADADREQPGAGAVPAGDDSVPAGDEAGPEAAAPEPAPAGDEAGPEVAAPEPAPEEPAPDEPAEVPAPAPQPPPGGRRRLWRRRRDPLAAALIALLTVLLGFAFAVQVRNTGTEEALVGAREEDLVRILDELDVREDRLRDQIAEQRGALRELTNTDSQSATALAEAQRRAEALGILNGTVAAEGPGLHMTILDPEGRVRVADLLDAIQELRGAGAETMQIDGVRIGVSTAVTGEPGDLRIDGRAVESPYEIVVIGSPPDLQTAMSIPGGVVDRVGRQGGTVEIAQSDRVVVDALRPLDAPQYASPESDGDD